MAAEYRSEGITRSDVGATLTAARDLNGDFARTMVSADYGTLKAKTSVDRVGDYSLYADSTAEARMEDRLVIDRPGLTGTVGSFDLRYHLHAAWGAETAIGGSGLGVGEGQNEGSIRFGLGVSGTAATSPDRIWWGDAVFARSFETLADGST